MTITPNTIENTEEIVREVLGLSYDRFGFQNDPEQIAEIVALLEDEANAVKEYPEDPKAASVAAAKIREMLWNRYSGGGVSASATTELFLSLDRDNELGWVREEAGGYPEYKIERFINRLVAAREAKQNQNA